MTIQHISDVIGEAYKTWTPEKPVLINAPMGAGKTYFALNVLLPYIQQNGKRMVYLANRAALQQQINQLIPGEYKNAITTCSYQRFANINFAGQRNDMRNATERQKDDATLMNADYYILDEAHFFLSDSTFNMTIQQCYERMKEVQRRKRTSIWIYMTATMPYLLMFLSDPNILIPYLEYSGRYREVEGQFGYFNRTYFSNVSALLKYKEMMDVSIKKYDFPNQQLFSQYNVRKSWFSDKSQEYDDKLNKNIEKYDYYSMDGDYSYITPVYFNNWDEIVTAVQNTPASEKWLIFVKSKTDGEYLKEKMVENGIEETVFIHAKNRNDPTLGAGRTFQHIVECERYRERVMITTKVMDNGVNLKDNELRHVVIDAFEKTTFLQMLGRKRRTSKDDKIFLYLKNASEGTIRNQFKNQILSITTFLYDFLKISNREEIRDRNRNKDGFFDRYTTGGHYKWPYQAYLAKRSSYSPQPFGNSIAKDNPFLLIDIYEPAGYAKSKLTYDYYKMLAMFERAQNERDSLLNGREFQTEEERDRAEKSLQEKQFIWLKEQLSWIGLNSEKYDPNSPTYWITTQTGRSEKSYDALMAFLSQYEGTSILSVNEEADLKAFFCAWIQNIRPVHQYAKSKGSISIINRCFEEFAIPYQISSVKLTLNRKQRNWWLIEKVVDKSQDDTSHE